VNPRPDPVDVQALGRRWQVNLSTDDASCYAEFLDELLGDVDKLEAPASAQEATRSYPDRVAWRGGQDPFNAIVHRCSIAGGGEGPLAGKRVSVKDSISIGGVPLTAGSPILGDYVPDDDAEVVSRVLAAGAEIVATTNMDDLGFTGDGSTSCFGPVRNPFDGRRTAGGSSAGAAAALYYDDIDLAIGGDQSGSARVPASWSGVVGFKPTHGRVPMTGALGLDPTIDHIGVLARTVADAALLFDVVASTSGEATTAVASATEGGKRLRLGVLAEGFSPALGVEESTANAVRDLVGRVQASGIQVHPVSVPEHVTTGPIDLVLCCVGLTTLLQGGGNRPGFEELQLPQLAAALRTGLAQRGGQLSPAVKTGLLLGTWLAQERLFEPYAHAQNARRHLRKRYDDALLHVDALLLPTTPFPAPMFKQFATPADAVSAGWAPLANTSQFNLTGHPAVSVPLCEVDGLPFGVMLVGRRGEDAALLAYARILEATQRR
jgi:amidase